MKNQGIISLLAALILCGCVNGRVSLPFPLDEHGDVENPSKSKVCFSRKALASYYAGAPSDPQSKGIIIFDGLAIDSQLLRDEKQSITFRVSTVLLGSELNVPAQVSVISPMERYGGIPAAMGEKYRVAVIPLHGRYYTWASTGTAPADKGFAGLYACDPK
jgi:hypothetical protein